MDAKLKAAIDAATRSQGGEVTLTSEKPNQSVQAAIDAAIADGAAIPSATGKTNQIKVEFFAEVILNCEDTDAAAILFEDNIVPMLQAMQIQEIEIDELNNI